MATRKVVIVECDRCHQEVDEDLFKAEGGKVTLVTGPRRRLRVWDLCPSCRVLHDRFLEINQKDN